MKQPVLWCMAGVATDAEIVSSQLLIFLLLSLHLSLSFIPPQNVTHSFLQPVRLRLSFLHHSSLHRFLCFIKRPRIAAGPLAPWQRSARWRRTGSAVSAHRNALQQPLSRREGRSKLLTEEGGKNGSLHLPFPPGEERSNICLHDWGESPVSSIKATMLRQPD